MQNNIVIGNIGRIQNIEGTQKVYMDISDHYVTKDENGKYVKKTNWVPIEGFLPKGLTVKKGQLVAVRFRVTQYQKKDGSYGIANDLIDIDVTLNNAGKQSGESGEAAPEETPENTAAPETAPETDAATEQEMPFDADASAKSTKKKGSKKTA